RRKHFKGVVDDWNEGEQAPRGVVGDHYRVRGLRNLQIVRLARHDTCLEIGLARCAARVYEHDRLLRVIKERNIGSDGRLAPELDREPILALRLLDLEPVLIATDFNATREELSHGQLFGLFA